MSVALTEHYGPWTIADVEALPDPGDGSRFELLAPGVLTVSPAPALPHQRASRRLANLLEAAADTAGAGVEVFETVNVEIPGERLAEPDLVLIDRTFASEYHIRCPASVVLMVVEIVSPSTKPQDRLVKPRLYAEAGIPVYWRLEPEPRPRLIASELRRGQYVQTVTAVGGTTTRVEQPFPVEVDPDELVYQ